MTDKNPKEQFMFFTANCSLKYNNSKFPCECEPWHEHWYNPFAKEPNCQKCDYAIEVGAVSEPEEEEDGQEIHN